MGRGFQPSPGCTNAALRRLCCPSIKFGHLTMFGYEAGGIEGEPCFVRRCTAEGSAVAELWVTPSGSAGRPALTRPYRTRKHNCLAEHDGSKGSGVFYP